MTTLAKGAPQEFISAAQDVWDGKRKRILGLTIFLTDPNTFQTHAIPVALTPPVGEKAIDLCRECLTSLSRYGIQHTDLFRAVNDNCTTAKKAGRL
jgi:hypothetical protein